jgi:hypothetical protein
MAGRINLKLRAHFFNKTGHERTSRDVRAAAGVPARTCVDSVAEAH